jgi:hypothetical protein
VTLYRVCWEFAVIDPGQQWKLENGVVMSQHSGGTLQHSG